MGSNHEVYGNIVGLAINGRAINDANSNNIVVTDKTNEIKVLSFFFVWIKFQIFSY